MIWIGFIIGALLTTLIAVYFRRHLLTVGQANKRAENIIRLMRTHQVGFRRAVQMMEDK